MPMQRKRPARVGRPQVYANQYITTSFGEVPKRDIRNAVIFTAVFLASFSVGLNVFGWLLLWA